MNNNLQNYQSKPKFSVAIQSDAYKNLINNTLGDPEIARQFIADISGVVSNNPALQMCDAGSIISAGLTAQTLKLPLASSLGFAYVVPYKDKAQFQIGYKGYIQLAMRSGLFETIGVRPVHDGEYIGQDEFGDDIFKFNHDYDLAETVGYFAYFKLTNGFKKTLYWTVAQCDAHARKYSRAYGSGKTTDLWGNSFDTMAQKTVLKMLLSKYAPMSVDIEKGLVADQAVVKNDGTYEYVDNEDLPDWAETPTAKPVSATNDIDNDKLAKAFAEAKKTKKVVMESAIREDDEDGRLF